jgi:hypothetical protein
MNISNMKRPRNTNSATSAREVNILKNNSHYNKQLDSLFMVSLSSMDMMVQLNHKLIKPRRSMMD